MPPEDDPHRLCKVELKVAVIESEAKGTAQALVLARSLAAAESLKMALIMSAVVGWLIAIGGILFGVLRR
jgi:hypothetical protein